MANRTVRAVGDRIIVRPVAKSKSSGIGSLSSPAPDMAPATPSMPGTSQAEPRPTSRGTVISVGRSAYGPCCPGQPKAPTPEVKQGDVIAYKQGAGDQVVIAGATYACLSPWDVIAVIE